MFLIIHQSIGRAQDIVPLLIVPAYRWDVFKQLGLQAFLCFLLLAPPRNLRNNLSSGTQTHK